MLWNILKLLFFYIPEIGIEPDNNSKISNPPFPNFEYWSGQGCIVIREKSFKEEIEVIEEVVEKETKEIIAVERPKIKVSQELDDIGKFLEKMAKKNKNDPRDHDDFNFQAVFKKSIKEPKSRLIYWMHLICGINKW